MRCGNLFTLNAIQRAHLDAIEVFLIQEIADEKYELLYKIDALKKKGISIPGTVTIESSIDEIKYVYNRDIVEINQNINMENHPM